MAVKYFCDVCKREIKDPIRVGWRAQYCKKCWLDKKNWPKIHKKKDDYIFG